MGGLNQHRIAVEHTLLCNIILLLFIIFIIIYYIGVQILYLFEIALPAQGTTDLAVLVFAPDAFCAKRMETYQNARVVVIVLAQKAQQRIATGRRRPVAGRRVRGRDVRRHPLLIV